MSSSESQNTGERQQELAAIRRVIEIERDALGALQARVDESYLKAVDLILDAAGSRRGQAAAGRLIITGLGKSGAIGRKIAATMTSTGTPAIYVHTVEGAHGDFGLIQPNDVALVISKSGAGEELNVLLPFLKRRGVRMIAVTHDIDSPLAHHADVVLDASIEQEACPHGVAPTTSSTVALVIGDALAVALMTRQGFSREDFARFHPGGALGRRLLMTVQDVLPEDRELAFVSPEASLADVVVSIGSSRCGATMVLEEGRLLGLITDGDLRRHMAGNKLQDLSAADLMSPRPKTISATKLAAEAVEILNRHKIQQLVVLDEAGRAAAILHLHDLLAQGIR